jgi:hypothetical protein
VSKSRGLRTGEQQKTTLRKEIYIVTLNVTRYLDSTVFVSIPAIFDDGACRAYKLLGVELNGLWLQSDELTERLLPRDHEYLASYTPATFVPFAQIAGVMVATSTPPSATLNGEPSAGTRSASTNKPKQRTQAAGSSPRKPRPKKSSIG